MTLSHGLVSLHERMRKDLSVDQILMKAVEMAVLHSSSLSRNLSEEVSDLQGLLLHICGTLWV